MLQTISETVHDWRSYHLAELEYHCPWIPALLLVEVEDLPKLAMDVCTDFDYRMHPWGVFRLFGPVGFLQALEERCRGWLA